MNIRGKVKAKKPPVNKPKINIHCKILCVNEGSGKELETTYKEFKKATEDFWERGPKILSVCQAAFTQHIYRSGNSQLDGLFVRWEQRSNGVVVITATIHHEETTSLRPLEEETLL